MMNVQDFITNTTVFKKFGVDDLLFAEIICPVEEGSLTSLWWHDNFFSYAISGEMLLKTLGESPGNINLVIGTPQEWVRLNLRVLRVFSSFVNLLIMQPGFTKDTTRRHEGHEKLIGIAILFALK